MRENGQIIHVEAQCTPYQIYFMIDFCSGEWFLHGITKRVQKKFLKQSFVR